MTQRRCDVAGRSVTRVLMKALIIAGWLIADGYALLTSFSTMSAKKSMSRTVLYTLGVTRIPVYSSWSMVAVRMLYLVHSAFWIWPAFRPLNARKPMPQDCAGD